MRDAREPRQRLRDGPEGHAARPAPGVARQRLDVSGNRRPRLVPALAGEA